MVGTGPYKSLTDSFWENYVKGRPQVPESFFHRIFEYHATHGGKFNVVNDVGAGVGNHSVRLAKRFAAVVVTEPDETSLGIAEKSITKETSETTKYRFVKAQAEDDVQDSGSVDMVFTANTLHWADLNKSLESFAKQLKPGGTLCIGVWFTTFLLNKEADRVWVKLFSAFREDVLGWWDSTYETRQRGYAQDSGGDSVPLSDELFRPGAQRVKLNAGGKETFAFFRDFPADFEVRTGPNDQIISEIAPDWYFEADLAQLKVMFNTFPLSGHEEEVNSLWREMESILDGGTTKGYWPAGIVLATRK
jgi:trans-aconitate 3-methyltransferase